MAYPRRQDTWRFVPWPLGSLLAPQGSATAEALRGRFQILGLLPRLSLPLTIALGASVVVTTFLPLGFTLASGLLIGALATGARQGITSPAGQTAVGALAALAAISLVQQGIGPLRTVVATMLAQRLELHLEERVMRAVGHPVGIAHLEDAAALDRLALAQEVGLAGDRPRDVVLALSTLLPRWFQSVVYAVVLAGFRWWLGLAVFAAWYYAASMDAQETARGAQVIIANTRLLRRANYVRDLALTPDAAKEVRVFGLLDWLLERFGGEWLRAMQSIRQEHPTGIAAPLRSLVLLTAVLAGAGGLLGVAALHGEIGVGALAVFAAAALGVGSLYGLTPDDRVLVYGSAAMPAVSALEHSTGMPTHSVTVTASETPGAGARQDSQPGTLLPQGDIRFVGVRFRYPGSTTDTLRGLDLTIPAGHSLAIVGANGAGKTTLVKLLCRFYEPQAGRITVDGHALTEFDARFWQRQIAAIFQDFVRYPLSLRDNVAVGAVEQGAHQERLLEAARTAGVLDLVAALPCGWETVLSREFTGGADLSGGQWQRVALARALFAASAGARVLILDEPTAHLDVRAEAELYDHFLEITAGLTTVLISHRFSTVRRAHHICVLDQGRVVEFGTHDTLMAAQGRYAALFTLQASRFTTDGRAAHEDPDPDQSADLHD